MSSVNLEWHAAMDALCAHTKKNWWSTGHRKCAAGVSGSVSLQNNSESNNNKNTTKGSK
tara:strand:- start:10069 stop:10245 length:177 start_codon:yes stop_codon:yes gene_type:complete